MLLLIIQCQKQLRLNAALEKFYLEKAFGHQIDEYTEFKHYIENALQEVAKKYPRFRSSKVELVGSSATDVFALLKKEMDLLLIFNIKGVITETNLTPLVLQDFKLTRLSGKIGKTASITKDI